MTLVNSVKRAGIGYSTCLADMDFETYSEAGYTFNGVKWQSIVKSPPHGIGAVGAPVYAEQPSTEVLSLAYDLKDGLGARLWVPGAPEPADLFDHIKAGGLIEAVNSAFEYYIWLHVCHRRMGWPELPVWQLRDAAAKARAFSIPGSLKKAGAALKADIQKMAAGTALLNKFSRPRNPTKNDSRLRILPEHDPDGPRLYLYNIKDIEAEADVSARCADLSPQELEVWLCDQAINTRGVQIDSESVDACVKIVNEAHEKYTAELSHTTGGAVTSPSEVKKITDWLADNGQPMYSLEADIVAEVLAKPDLAEPVRKVLKIRQSLGASSVKKLYSMQRRTSADGRLRDLLVYCGADRTGRWAGRGPQPQNLPSSGPEVLRCGNCGAYCGVDTFPGKVGVCEECDTWDALEPDEWGPEAVEYTLELIKKSTLADVEHIFGDAIAAISGCLRGLFVSAPGHDLICSDYSAIEAVVLAALAGEEWRLDVFRTHGMIYEVSAAKITGTPFDDFVKHKQDTGKHHPLRKSIGKVAELASGYQGSVGAWKMFGAGAHFDTDDEILAAVKAWRAANPMIVKFWYNIQDAAIDAVRNPGQYFSHRGITFGMRDDVLYCRLLSGRFLCYHSPRLHQDRTPYGREVLKLSYMGSDQNGNWVRLDTYGGKLTENIVQGVARDILAHAIVNLERSGYPVVLHVHDEVVTERREGDGSVDEVEKIMATLPQWCASWPIKAAGGWRGKRYRKD